RRSGRLTDVQFAEMRYSGKPAAFLRGFRAIYLGLLMNCLILGWVTKAMTSIVATTMGISETNALWICVFFLIPFTGLYVALGGLWGVLWTDLFQFVLKMSIVIAVAWYAVSAIGGIHPMLDRLAAMRAAAGPNASAAPWFLAALAVIVLYPGLAHPEPAYMRLVNDHMPHALRGIVFAGFMAAFMSTIATQLNWGASYLVADFYRRFIKRDGDEKHYVLISRLATVLLVIVSSYVSAQLGS